VVYATSTGDFSGLFYFINTVTNTRQNLIGFSAPTLCIYEFYYVCLCVYVYYRITASVSGLFRPFFLSCGSFWLKSSFIHSSMRVERCRLLVILFLIDKRY